jgi:hypothetical protein
MSALWAPASSLQARLPGCGKRGAGLPCFPHIYSAEAPFTPPLLKRRAHRHRHGCEALTGVFQRLKRRNLSSLDDRSRLKRNLLPVPAFVQACMPCGLFCCGWLLNPVQAGHGHGQHFLTLARAELRWA